mmetsp:Transcript_76637/g.205609  ORF Transcript_76637/g.205609 Transcript_76637/m.205609 type:complete len:298 (-) Transcript_76637:87-980(-)
MRSETAADMRPARHGGELPVKLPAGARTQQRIEAPEKVAEGTETVRLSSPPPRLEGCAPAQHLHGGVVPQRLAQPGVGVAPGSASGPQRGLHPRQQRRIVPPVGVHVAPLRRLASQDDHAPARDRVDQLHDHVHHAVGQGGQPEQDDLREALRVVVREERHGAHPHPGIAVGEAEAREVHEPHSLPGPAAAVEQPLELQRHVPHPVLAMLVAGPPGARVDDVATDRIGAYSEETVLPRVRPAARAQRLRGCAAAAFREGHVDAIEEGGSPLQGCLQHAGGLLHVAIASDQIACQCIV